MKMLDRSRVYSEVAGSFNGYEQDGILFLKNGMPLEQEKEEVKEPQKEEVVEKKEKAEKKEVAEKTQLPEPPIKKRRGRPPKKKTVVTISEMETLPETHPISPASRKQEKNYDQRGPTIEQTQITDDEEVII
jgi:hypothetical protein